MPVINFTKIPEPQDFNISDGWHVSYISEIAEGSSRDGSDQWKVTYMVDNANDADHGKKLNDFLTFSEKALYRVRDLCQALGADTSRDANLDLQPKHLIGKHVMINVCRSKPRVDAETGESKTFACIAFRNGFKKIQVAPPAPPKQSQPAQAPPPPPPQPTPPPAPSVQPAAFDEADIPF